MDPNACFWPRPSETGAIRPFEFHSRIRSTQRISFQKCVDRRGYLRNQGSHAPIASRNRPATQAEVRIPSTVSETIMGGSRNPACARGALPRFGIFPVFSRAGAKVNGRSSFMAKSERQLRLSCFAPFVESVGRNQAATLKKRLAVRRPLIDSLSSGVDGPVLCQTG